MLVSGAASLLTFVALLVASAPGPRAKKRRWSINPAKDMRYLAARRQVLDILVQRKVAGDLDADTRKRMGQCRSAAGTSSTGPAPPEPVDRSGLAPASRRLPRRIVPGNCDQG